MNNEKKQVKALLVIYTFALIISGYTAMIIPEGLQIGMKYIPSTWTTVYAWILYIHEAVEKMPRHLLYGYDWLAFGHYAIAIAFYGTWKNPTQNRWVIQWAMIISIMIIPFAFLMGAIRDIPFWWQLIDCSFGVFSLILLIMIDRRIKVLLLSELKEDLCTPKFI